MGDDVEWGRSDQIIGRLVGRLDIVGCGFDLVGGLDPDLRDLPRSRRRADGIVVRHRQPGHGVAEVGVRLIATVQPAHDRRDDPVQQGIKAKWERTLIGKVNARQTRKAFRLGR